MTNPVMSNPEQFLEDIKNKEKNIKSACAQLLASLRSINGINEGLITKVQKSAASEGTSMRDALSTALTDVNSAIDVLDSEEANAWA